MIEVVWSSDTVKDPIALADALEIAVAFAEDDYSGRFTRADFSQVIVSEIFNEDASSFLVGDEPDEFNEQFEQALQLIRDRALWLDDLYPFSVDKYDEVKFVPGISVNRCIPYLFLLMCSNRNFVPLLKNTLPVSFESLCKEALCALFPDWAEVLLFSQNSDDRKDDFGWKASDAIRTLANKLNAEIKNSGRLPDTQREFGIDIIAICPFDDQAPYPFFAFAQCTVGQDWWEKKHEAKATHELVGFIDLNAQHSNFLMIPHFPRYNLKEWSEDPARTGDCILFDRYRICRLLEKSSSFKSNGPPASVAGVFGKIGSSLAQPP